MKITFYANACCTFEEKGFKILCDPWLVDGVFDGAWYHFPPLKVKPQDLADVDCLYISHLHPDHYDINTLQHFRKDIPIIALDHGKNFLHKILKSKGYNNLITMKDGESKKVGPFQTTLYSPFDTHIFHESKVGNLVDCALIVDTGTHSVLNTNDNTPSLESAKKLRQKHGEFTVAQLNYNAAGPYPSCFNNLSKEEKIKISKEVVTRNLKHMQGVADILSPRYVMPFAGAYVLGGKNWEKNEYLGTITWDGAVDFFKKNSPETKMLVLREGQSFDLKKEEIINGPYVPVNIEEQNDYIKTVLSQKKYPYEEDPAVEASWFEENLPLARENLWVKQNQINCFEKNHIYVKYPQGYFYFPFHENKWEFVSESQAHQEPYLECTMDPRLLKQTLTQKAHWNNLEIGCHIEFRRSPNDYLPDVHTLLSFFHLPVRVKTPPKETVSK